MKYRILTVLFCLATVSLLSGCVSTLHKAAYEGDTKTVLAELNDGEDINSEGSTNVNAALLRIVTLGFLGTGLSVLEAAIAGGHEETVKALLDRGLSVNQKVRGGDVPAVLFACDVDQPKLVELFLDQGADPKAASTKRWTLLHSAAFSGYDRIVERALKGGSDPNASHYNWGTPLHVAATKGHSKIVQLLLAHGANAGIADGKGVTPLKYAKKFEHSAIVRLLEQAEARESGLVQAPAALPQVAAVPVPTMPAIQSDVDRMPALKIATKKNAYAVVIGIEQYREKLPKADFADRDAKLVGEYLAKVMGYPEENVIVRTNDKAAKTDLEKYFEEWLRNNVEADGAVFVYYSGHGAPNVKNGEAYLVPYDGDSGFLETTGYPLKRLYAALDKLPAKDVTVVLDSCFSGAGGRSVIAQGLRPMGLSVEHAMKASGKTVVLSASSGEQVSSTYLNQGHGLLTYFFLKGLQGEGDLNNDGTIDMAELYDYVKPNVQRVARKQYNNEQTPQLLASPDVLKRGGGRLLDRKQP